MQQVQLCSRLDAAAIVRCILLLEEGDRNKGVTADGLREIHSGTLSLAPFRSRWVDI